jgi:hypothetical protein
MTGAGALPEGTGERQTATQVLNQMPRPPRVHWRRRDWLLVGGAGILGLIAGAAIVRKKRD